jgi:hypothetical protein
LPELRALLPDVDVRITTYEAWEPDFESSDVDAAVVQGRPFVIAFEKDGFGCLDGGGGADGHVTTPKGMKVSFQRWNGGKKWNSAEGLNWTFYPSGICDALRFKFEHPDGMVEMAFNPLTGSVSEEAAYLR